MAKVGDLVLELIVDGKKGQVVLKDFVSQLGAATRQAQAETEKMKTGFQRVHEMGQKLFFTINGYRALLGPLGNLTHAANDLDSSHRKLEATSRLTGASLDGLRSTADEAKNAYQLNTIQANELTISLTKLEQKAGETGVANEAMGRLLDLAAAQGLNAEQAMTALQQSLLGIDEGTDKLFQKNPSVIYAEYAKQIGTTAGMLTDQQKAQALLNAVMTDGLKVQGTYQKFLQSEAGVTAAAAARADELRAKAGALINQVWVPILEIATPIMEFFTSLDLGTQKLIASVAIFAAAGWKLIPMFTAWKTSITVLGISIKTALGWIGLIITAATLIYQAWNSNLFGIRNALSTAWEYLKFWVGAQIDVVRAFASNFGEIMGSVGELLKNVFTLNVDEIDDSWNRVKLAVTKSFQDAGAAVVERYRAMHARLAEMDRQRESSVRAAAAQEIRVHQETAANIEAITEQKVSAQNNLTSRYIANAESEFARLRELNLQHSASMTRIDADAANDRTKISDDQFRTQAAQASWFFNTVENGYGAFFNSLTDMELSSKERRERIWQSMRATFIGELGEMLKNYIVSMATQEAVHATVETTKTAITREQTAAREGISVISLAKEMFNVLKSIGAWIGQMTAKLFAWLASLGPFGLLAGAGLVTAAVATVKGIISKVMKFAEGGIATDPVMAMIGEAGDNEAVIPLNRRGAEFMAQMIPKIVLPQAADNSSLNVIERSINELTASIQNMKLSARFDPTDLAVIVEKGNQRLSTLNF